MYMYVCIYIYIYKQKHCQTKHEKTIPPPPTAADRSEGFNYTIAMHITPHTMIVDMQIVQHI